MLTPIKFVKKSNEGREMWLCRCDCGNEKVVQKRYAVSGKTQSCGCILKMMIAEVGRRSATHGMSYSRTYRSWRSMLARCHNKNAPDYERYGGRGITVCDRWKDSFENFLEDMGERPEKKSLDRIRNDEEYSKQNCKWSTPKEQSNNRGNSLFIEKNGIKLTIPQWGRLLNIPRGTLFSRYYNGWTVEKILSKTV